MKITSSCFISILIIFAQTIARAQSAAPCTQTLSPGSNIASAVASAPNDSVICLNTGNYGTVSLDNLSRSAFVTLRSTSGQGATINPQIGSSSFIRLQSLTMVGAHIHACAHHIEIRNNKFTSGFLINNRDGVCPANLNLLIDGNDFGDLGPALWEGRLSVGDRDGDTHPMGLIISNNRFHDGCQSDGIQVVGGAGGITIGPGNIFENIIQSGPVHCDSIQFYSSGPPSTIMGNWFKNASVAIQHHPSIRDTTFRDNLITNVDQIQIGLSPGFIFEHNTIHNLSGYFGFDSNTNSTFRNNIISGTSVAPNISSSTGTFSHQLCSTSEKCIGTNQIIAAPDFIGGSNPTTWADYRLTSTSRGHLTGSDGKDRGTNFYGGAAPVSPPAASPLAAPKNLRLAN